MVAVGRGRFSRRGAAAVLALLAAGPARAEDAWSEPAPGLRLLRRTTDEPWRIFAVEADLCAPGVSLRATAEDEKRRTTSSFAELVGAAAAVNGDFFSWSTYDPGGLAVGDGAFWHADNTWEAGVEFGQDHALIADPEEVLSEEDAPAWVSEVVSGYPVLVEEGAALTSFSRSDCSDRHPRTAVGLSEDRRTLWLAVVDGRSSASAGMTCAELADLMVDLGAWRAVNLDGGGSSTLWVEGEGVVNDPSDGGERTVSNHLAVLATGEGAPESCDFWLAEVVWDAWALDARVVDVDGDGRSDLCGRADAGWRCWPARRDGFGEAWELDDLGDARGWSAERYHLGIRMGDIDGDGRTDLCARGARRVYCWRSTGEGWGERIDVEAFSDEDGYAEPGYASTLRLADVTGDGRADLCARGPDGITCLASTGDGFSGEIAGPELSDATGWNHPRYYGTIRTGDVNGDGRADLCARGAAGTWCWLSDGDGFSTRLDGPAWSDAAGWDRVERWGTIRLADVDGDGRADLCGRSGEGWRCAFSTGDGFGEEQVGPELSDAAHWDDHSNASTARLADLDGDGDLDLCARANRGWWCWPFEDGTWGDRVELAAMTDEEGWDDPRRYATIRVGDLDGDGRADVCGRDADGLRCWLGTGTGFVESGWDGSAWSDAAGWDDPANFTTLRLAAAASPGVDTGAPPRAAGW